VAYGSVGEEDVLGADGGPGIASCAGSRLGEVVEVATAGRMACSTDATSVIAGDPLGITLSTGVGAVGAVTKVDELVAASSMGVSPLEMTSVVEGSPPNKFAQPEVSAEEGPVICISCTEGSRMSIDVAIGVPGVSERFGLTASCLLSSETLGVGGITAIWFGIELSGEPPLSLRGDG
jgi:hypothetical protein